jgi:hypothetical protein
VCSFGNGCKTLPGDTEHRGQKEDNPIVGNELADALSDLTRSKNFSNKRRLVSLKLKKGSEMRRALALAKSVKSDRQREDLSFFERGRM